MVNYPKAFIFDLDGVITDTAEYHFVAWKHLAQGLGIQIDREFNEELKGISRMESLDRILALSPDSGKYSQEDREELAVKKNEEYIQLIQSIGPEDILPGITELLTQIRIHKLKIGLASASKNAPMILQRLGLIDYFDYIVNPAALKKGKPDPEIFTTAADKLGVSSTECIGIEDASSGVEAINKANMFSVGVGSSTVLSAADYVVSQTSELHFDKIIEQYNRK